MKLLSELLIFFCMVLRHIEIEYFTTCGIIIKKVSRDFS